MAIRGKGKWGESMGEIRKKYTRNMQAVQIIAPYNMQYVHDIALYNLHRYVLINIMQRAIKQRLIAWKSSQYRKPLIIRGARQVGKTYTIREFGQTQFANTVEINFDQKPALKNIFQANTNPQDIIQQLTAVLNTSIIAGETLLFLDEIQECPEAISALRYFFELMPELHIICAGSLLEFALHSSNFKMPVGRIEFMYLYPLSFSEFLAANAQSKLQDYINSMSLTKPIPEALHQALLKQLKYYYTVGGMPLVVQRWLNTGSFQEERSIIIQTYRNDFGKYANIAKHQYLDKVFSITPTLVGQKYKYVNIDKDLQSRPLKEALYLLIKAGLIKKVFATPASGLPFQYKDEIFKAIFLDVGLMQHICGLDSIIALSEDFLAINSGAIAEQFVGQELLAYSPSYEAPNLYFWNREKVGSQAEVDYLIQHNSQIIPIEVKAGKTGRLKSLQLFMYEHKSTIGVRISQKPLEQEQNILSIPLYAIEQIPRLIGSTI